MSIIERGRKIRDELKDPENKAKMELITMMAKNFADAVIGLVPDYPIATSPINDVLVNVGNVMKGRERGESSE